MLIVSDINSMFLPRARHANDLFEGYQVIELDASRLAGVDGENDPGRRHEQFVSGGIERAANALVGRYPSGVDVALGLSVGGTILWRAALKGLPVNNLVCLSSTRLRFETLAPQCTTHLYFGELDPDRPNETWSLKLGRELDLVNGQGHGFYRDDGVFEILRKRLQM